MACGRIAAVLLSGALCLGAAAPASAGMPCTAWLSRTFFEKATATDVSRCLDAGADPRGRVGGPWQRGSWFANILVDTARGLTGHGRFSDTPLHLAAAFGRDPSVIEALLDAGADPEARTADGRSPRDFARNNANLEGTAVYRRLNEAGPG